MTFLKKLGQALARGLQIAAAVGGVTLPFLTGKAAAIGQAAVGDFQQAASIVVGVEAVVTTPGSGATKLAAATPLMASFIKSTELIAGKKIANEDLFIQGSKKISDGMADILNSLHPDAVQTVSNS